MVYHDVGEVKGAYIQASVGHSVAIFDCGDALDRARDSLPDQPGRQHQAHGADEIRSHAHLVRRDCQLVGTHRLTRGDPSVVLHKYLSHKGINAYIGVHGYNDQEVATATG